MSILIKGMEMPQGCGDCPCIGGEYHGSYDNHFYCQVTDKGIGEHKPDWCPLVRLSEPKKSDDQYYRDIAKAYNVMLYGVPRHQTNSDKLRYMTDDELANWLAGVMLEAEHLKSKRKDDWLNWLKEEAKE